MPVMAARMDAVMAQLRTTPRLEPAPRPSRSADRGASAHDRMAFPPLPQLINPGGM